MAAAEQSVAAGAAAAEAGALLQQIRMAVAAVAAAVTVKNGFRRHRQLILTRLGLAEQAAQAGQTALWADLGPAALSLLRSITND
jgi:hypothetical protein